MKQIGLYDVSRWQSKFRFKTRPIMCHNLNYMYCIKLLEGYQNRYASKTGEGSFHRTKLQAN